MQLQRAAFESGFIAVAEIDEHGDEAPRVIAMAHASVADASLMDVHAHPQLLGRMFDSAQRASLLVDAVFAVGNVARFGEIDRASLARGHVAELAYAPLDELLRVKAIHQRAPAGLALQELFVALVIPIQREAGGTAARWTLGERVAQPLVRPAGDEMLVRDMSEGMVAKRQLAEVDEGHREVGLYQNAAVRIFIEPSGNRWENIGDAAMFTVAMARLRGQWPDARVTVHCLAPDALRNADAAAIPLDPRGARAWDVAPQWLRRRMPGAAAQIARAALSYAHLDPELTHAYRDAVRNADLVLVTGAGSFNDVFRVQSMRVLETLALAQANGAKTVLVGQGIGPMTDRRLRARAAEVLPRATFIALREGVHSPQWLDGIGVPRERVCVTGDDAIPLAYDHRPTTLGNALAVNVRVSPYSAIQAAHLAQMRNVLRSYDDVVLLPIGRDAAHDDLIATRTLELDAREADVRTPSAFLRELRACGVMVTASYHAAVFALAMGIPAVTIAAARYYVEKFEGLRGQFGEACRVLHAASPSFEEELRVAVDDVYRSGGETREGLLERAREQIAQAERAWRSIA